MRNIDLAHPTPAPAPEDRARVARLTRHLQARLLDFGPGGPEVIRADQNAGAVTARFPGHPTGQVLSALSARGIQAAQQGDDALFLLSPATRFEDLDRVWGCLFDILE